MNIIDLAEMCDGQIERHLLFQCMIDNRRFRHCRIGRITLKGK